MSYNRCTFLWGINIKRKCRWRLTLISMKTYLDGQTDIWNPRVATQLKSRVCRLHIPYLELILILWHIYINQMWF